MSVAATMRENAPVDARLGPSHPVMVGRVLKPVGLRGRIKVEPWSDAPDRFAAGSRLWILAQPPQRLTVKEARPAPDGRLVLEFVGGDSVEAVEAWRGCVLAIDESERAPLPEGQFYHDELRGMAVITETGARVGVVHDVWATGPNDVLALRDGESERLLPLIKQFVVRVDRAGKTIVVRPPAGWMDDVAV